MWPMPVLRRQVFEIQFLKVVGSRIAGFVLVSDFGAKNLKSAVSAFVFLNVHSAAFLEQTQNRQLES